MEEQKKVKVEDFHFPTPRNLKRSAGEINSEEDSKKKISAEIVADQQDDSKRKRLKEMVRSSVMQSMKDRIEEEGLRFDMIDGERAQVLFELWKCIKVAELEVRLKKAMFNEELFKSICLN
jgi:hypothetical protein